MNQTQTQFPVLLHPFLFILHPSAFILPGPRGVGGRDQPEIAVQDPDQMVKLIRPVVVTADSPELVARAASAPSGRRWSRARAP